MKRARVGHRILFIVSIMQIAYVQEAQGMLNACYRRAMTIMQNLPFKEIVVRNPYKTAALIIGGGLTTEYLIYRYRGNPECSHIGHASIWCMKRLIPGMQEECAVKKAIEEKDRRIRDLETNNNALHNKCIDQKDVAKRELLKKQEQIAQKDDEIAQLKHDITAKEKEFNEYKSTPHLTKEMIEKISHNSSQTSTDLLKNLDLFIESYTDNFEQHLKLCTTIASILQNLYLLQNEQERQGMPKYEQMSGNELAQALEKKFKEFCQQLRKAE